MRQAYNIAAALVAATTTIATPTISFPFNSQLPPVARVSSEYSYTFSTNTFSSNLDIKYTLNNAPDWISVDSKSRRIHGTPPDDFVASGNSTGVDMILVASDSEGSAEMNATIVVSKNPAPTLLKPLEDQISGFGDFSAPSSLLLYPSTAFNFSFDPSTFANALGSLDYYAVSGDGSPLPAWVIFNSETLQFSGTSPPFESLISPPQVFDLQFVASDVPGFSAISMSFDITVGTRKLTSENPIIVLNVTKSDTISYDGLKDEIELDGSRVSPGNLTVDTENMPSWVSFNEDTWDISGTAPSEAESTKFLIQFKDSLSDSLGVQVVVNIADSLFTDKIPSIKIAPGEAVDFDFARYVSNASDVAITIDSNQSWLKINGLKLAGTAPRDLQPSTFQLTVTANSQTLTGVKQTIQAVVDITDETGSGSDGSHKKSDKLSKGQIALVVILPIVCAILLAGIVICLVKHRRRRNPRPKTIIVEEIIGPLPSDLRRDETRTSFDERSPTDSEYCYIDNFPFHGQQSKTYGNQGGGLRGAYSDSDMARDLTVDTRTARSFSESGPRRSESWVTIEANPRSPQKAFMSKASRLGRDATFQSEAVSNTDQSSWYTEPQTSSFRREPDLSAPSLPDLPDLGPFPEMPETRRSLDMSSDRDVPMVDILDQEVRRSEEVARAKEQEEEDQELPQIQHGTDRSLPDIPSSEALPSIRESSTPSPPPPAHLSSLLGNVRRPQSPPMVHVWPDATPHPDDATPTPLSLSRNPSLSQAEKAPLSNRTTHYSYTPGEPSIPRKSSRRTGGQGSLTPSKSNSNLNMRVSLGPRMNERHKQPTTASLESMQGKENQLAADNWKSGASREYLDIPYRDLYGGTVSSGSTRRSVSSAESRSYSSGSRQSSLHGGSSDRRRMTHNGPSRRKASGSRRTSGSAVSDEFMQSIPIGYEGDNPRSMGLPYLGYGEYPVSKPSFITAREFQSMSTVNSLGTEGGFI